jgi:hypothetical protein
VSAERSCKKISKCRRVLDTLKLVTVGEEELDPELMREVEVVRMDTFRGAVLYAIKNHDFDSGVLVIIADLDGVFRRQAILEHILRAKPGIVRQGELEFGEETKNMEGVELMVWSDQPERGFEVAAFVSRLRSIAGQEYEYPPKCFEKRGIKYVGAKVRKLMFYSMAHKGSSESFEQVCNYLDERYRLGDIGRIVVMDDRWPGVGAGAELIRHVREEHEEFLGKGSVYHISGGNAKVEIDEEKFIVGGVSEGF